ncbi:MAG: hypothetical protein RLZZ505_340 [Verrucomicrobiota bacterium]|jgi:hypothetical protein
MESRACGRLLRIAKKAARGSPVYAKSITSTFAHISLWPPEKAS